MTSKIVVKDNALIDASFNLSLVEQRVMLLAIVDAREKEKLTPDTPIEVTALEYSKLYSVDASTAYRSLTTASKTLKRREFSYLDRYKGEDGISIAGWVNTVTHVPSMGMIVVYLSKQVIQMIQRLETQFTRYHLEQVKDFNSKYSIRLYELTVKWLNAGATEKYAYEDLRAKLGVDPSDYKTMSLFKTNVLEKAIKEINKESDIKLKYEQFRTGRSISHFSFSVKSKMVIKPIEVSEELKFELSTAQINLFAAKLARDGEFGAKYAKTGETAEDFEIRISGYLVDPKYCKQHSDYLIRLGYSEKPKRPKKSKAA